MKCSVTSIVLCLAVCLVATKPSAGAGQYFVSPTGSDSADGSLGSPFQTITRALSVAQPGDSVQLRAGTYREVVSPVRGGVQGSPITIENYNGEQVIVSALDLVSGPWTAQGNGVYSTTVTGGRPVSFWTTPTTSANGSGIVDSGGVLRLKVVNESTSQSTSLRSQAARSEWDFFSNQVTWKVRGISVASTGAVAMPISNFNTYFTIANATSSGFASEDAANVGYRGDGRLTLNLKKNTVSSWGTTVETLTDATISGFDLTLGPASGGSVPYTFTAKRASGADVVMTGSWAITQAEWSDGGSGDKSCLGIFAQESVATTNTAQQVTVGVDSYSVSRGAVMVLRDEFDDGEVGSATEFPASLTSSLSSGYDQIFVNGAMQDEARMPNRGTGTLMAPTTASVTVTNASAATNPNTISSATFGGKPVNFFTGARFVGGIGVKWSWQNAVVATSSGNLLTVNPATKSTWWWPDYTGTTNTTDTGTGFVYGLLSLLDADEEWFLDQPTATLSLRIAGAVDPTGHVVEIKRRNWCVNINGLDYIAVRGLKTIGGAIRLNGLGNQLENCDASFLSHYLVWSNGSASNGGRAEGGGVVVSGVGNSVRGCTIHDTAGSGIVTSGTGHLITRNHLYNIDYSGTYASPLALGGEDMTATFNSIHDTGRDGIRPTGSGASVMFNDVSYCGRFAHDLGGVYTYGAEAVSQSGRRSRIAYNWVHDRGDATDTLSKGIYLDNGSRNFVVDHNVTWNCSNAAVRFNSPTFGHTVYHNTVIGTGSYNDSTWSNYETTSPTYGGLTFTDATHGMDFLAWNNMNVPSASTTAAFENFATQDFRPKAGYAFTDKRYSPATTTAVNPAALSDSVEWIKAAGNTSLTNPYITLAMQDASLSFFYRESFGHGQIVSGINAWVPDGKPDSGAYERGVARWVPGSSGWDGWKTDPPVNLGARTAVLQGVRLSLDTPSATNVKLCFGTVDGGTNAAAWENVADLGTAVPGDVFTVFRPALEGLSPGTTYYARFFASDANGVTWSDAQSFTTAASLTWDAGGGATTNISTNTNWLADVTPDLTGGGEIAIFGSAGNTATIDTAVSLLGIVINRDANFAIANGAGSLALGASGITVSLPGTTARTHSINESNLALAADQTWSITNNTGAAALNVASSIGGAFGFTKTGSGNLTLSGDSNFAGGVNVNAGSVIISHSNALGGTAGVTTIAATGSTATGGQVSLTGGITTPEDFVITGTTEAGSFARVIDNAIGTNTITGSIILVGTLQVRMGAGAGTLNFDGPIARNGTDSGPLMITAASGAVSNVTQSIHLNGAALNFTGAGTIALHAPSPNIGNATIFFGSPATNGTTVRLGANNVLATNRNLTIGTTSTSNGADRGTLDLAGFDQTVNALIGSVGTGTSPSAASTRRVTNSSIGSLSTLTIGSGNGSSTFNGLIEDGVGRVALVKLGTGTLTLPTPSTYTGDTTVSAGTLSLSNASLPAASAVNLSSNSVLNLNFSGSNSITVLRINGLVQSPGTWGSLSSSGAHRTALITGSGLLNVTGTQPPYDSWALASGLDNSSTDKDATFTADPDHDGVQNLMEYATRMNGAASDAVPQWIVMNGNVLEFTFRKNKAATDVTFIVEWSDTLAEGSWNSVGVSPQVISDDGTEQMVKASVAAGTNGERFLRLKVVRP